MGVYYSYQTTLRHISAVSIF